MKKIRPTSGLVKQALFNILYDVKGLKFLDLFAGTGEIGITAYQKGASQVYFVEKDRKRAEKINKRLEKQCKECKVVSADALKFLKNFKGSFDIIFADPPYDYDKYERLITESLNKLSDGGVFILEHRSDKNFNSDESRKYGDTILSFWRKE
ncbi:RsmD family RNA methyltransferase [Persephonella sp.]